MAEIYEWGEIEFNLYDSVASQHPALYNDRFTQAIYDAALFNWDMQRSDRAALLEALRDRMWDEYGVDFESVFDWESYRQAYDNA